VGQRLLAIDVLAGAGGEDAGDGVPVVRRGDDDGIDVFALEEIAEVGVRLTALELALALLGGVVVGGHLLGGVAALGDHVADGHDLDVWGAEEAAQVAAAHGADADEPEGEAVVRGGAAAGPERGTQQRDAGRPGGERLQEAAA
jgi:hypothetical protein